MKRTNEHLHGPDYHLITCLETKVGIKRKAQNTQATTYQFIVENVMTVSLGAAAKLPKFKSLKRTIRRQRQVTNNVQPQPIILEDLEIPKVYKITVKGDEFLLLDSGPEFHRILIFGTHQNVEMLRGAQFWLDDGTFKTAPALFTQLYVIHPLRGGPNPLEDGHLLPSLFVLLANKTEVAYMRQILCPDALPIHLIVDFEKAVINSFQHFWPTTNIKGCFFCKDFINVVLCLHSFSLHFTPNMRIRYLPSIAFISSFDVRQYFKAVVEHLPMPASQN